MEVQWQVWDRVAGVQGCRVGRWRQGMEDVQREGAGRQGGRRRGGCRQGAGGGRCGKRGSGGRGQSDDIVIFTR